MEPLFYDGDLSATLDNLLAKAQRAIDQLPESQFRGADPVAIGARIIREYGVEPITLTEGAISVQATDADIDRRRIPDLDWGFPGDSATIRGTRVTYNVPYTGEETLFRLKPSSWTSVLPRAELTKAELRFHYEVQSSQVASTKASFDRDLGLTKQYLGWVNEQIKQFGPKLSAAVELRVTQRIARLNAAAEGLSQLGLPVRNTMTASADVHMVTSPSPAVSARPRAGTFQYDLALSFAGEDRPYVERVAAALTTAGPKVFYDRLEAVTLWGKDLVEHLQDIYQNQARFCVLFISKHYVARPWPTHERKSAQARALVAKEEYLLPARFDDTVVPGLQPTIGYVDLRSLTPEAFAELVLQKLGSQRV